MSTIVAIVPWALFVVMVLFGMVFCIIAWRGYGRAKRATQELQAIRGQLEHAVRRAEHAEAQIAAANQRANLAEQQVAHAEGLAQRAKEEARQAFDVAGDAAAREREALERAQEADRALRERRSAAEAKNRQAEARARALLDWAKSEWESRREGDRQKAQAQHGSFSAQLEQYLTLRAAPVTFRVESDVDRLAAPLIERYASEQTVDVDGDLVKVVFPVDSSLGFRA